MKKMLAILLIILLGIALGVGVATLRIKTAPWNPALDEGGRPQGHRARTATSLRTKAAQIGGMSVAALCRRGITRNVFDTGCTMLVFRFARPLAVGVVAVVLVSALGCPSSGEKPGAAQTSASETKPSSADEPIASAKPPVAEFQQPPALPPSEPPPRLPQEPDDVPRRQPSRRRRPARWPSRATCRRFRPKMIAAASRG